MQRIGFISLFIFASTIQASQVEVAERIVYEPSQANELPQTFANDSYAVERLAFTNAPDEKPSASEGWTHNLFVHFAIDPDLVQAALPHPLIVDTFPDTSGEKKAWVTVWAFLQEKTRLASMPEWLGGTFPDLHVHTVVWDKESKEFSIFVFRIWADSRLATWSGQKWYHAPMFQAEQSFQFHYRKGSNPETSYNLRHTKLPAEDGIYAFRSKAQNHQFFAKWKKLEPLAYDLQDAHNLNVFLHDRYQQLSNYDGHPSKVRHSKPRWKLHAVKLFDWQAQLEGLPFSLPNVPTYVTHGEALKVQAYSATKF